MNFGKYGTQNAKTEKYRKMKYEYDKNSETGPETYYSQQNGRTKKQDQTTNDFADHKLVQGKISQMKGSTEDFSFKIPVTRSHEPYIISIYGLNEDKNADRFSPELFFRNFYFDKKSLFNFLGIKQQQENYYLYTDDSINEILQCFKVEDSGKFYLEEEGLLNCLIKL